MPDIDPAAFKAVIFDHDGTLVDSEPTHLAAWQQTLQAFNQTITRDEYTRCMSGRPTEESAQYLQQRFSIDIDPMILFRRKRQVVDAYLEQAPFPLMNDARRLVESLAARGMPLAVASGALQPEVCHSISRHNLAPWFPVIATGNEVKNNKPHPDVYLLAANRLGVAPDQCCAIEDSDYGQMAAEAAGMFCLRLATYTELSVSSRCLRVDNLQAVIRWFKLDGDRACSTTPQGN